MSYSIQVEIINPLQFDGWDELVRTHPDTTFFHSSHWARVLNITYGYKPLYFTVRDNDNLSALIPLMEIDSFLTGKRGVSLPFTDYCGPIVSNVVDTGDIWEQIKEHGEKSGWKYIEFRGWNGFSKYVSPSSWYYEHNLKLSADVEHVRENFSDSHKRNIRKALKHGVETSISHSLEAMKDFYRLHLKTRRKHGLPPQPFSFFYNIHRFIIAKKQGFVLLANYKKRVIAGAIFFHDGKKAIYKFGASDNEYQKLRPNNLVFWKALENCCREGYLSCNFGRSDQGHTGLRKFKSGWGACESRLNYYKYIYKGNGNIIAAPKVDGLHTKIFNNMPLPILKFIGSIMYKHIG